VSKTPAPKASPKPKTPAVKAVATSKAKTPVKAPSKAVTPAAKPATPQPAPASAKAAAPKAKPVPVKVKAVPPATTPPKPPVPAPAAPAAASKPASPPAVPKPSRASARYASTTPAAAPLPPATSRFADRFAPPRPPTRQMNNLTIDSPKFTQVSDPKLANAWKGKAGKDLTEAELLAMPESEYMNDKQLEFFRTRLQTLKDDLLSNAGETTEHLREETSIVPDPADRATIEEEHALELRTRDRERKLLKKISQSLMRIDAGDYGFCDETGEPIGLGRLIARPTATLSLEAQQRRELKQKMFGD
jgi:DnaK suppressor protein